jgi:hypothetical protein
MRSRLGTLALAGAVLVTGCTGFNPAPVTTTATTTAPPTRATTPASAATTTTAATATTRPVETRAFYERTCVSRISSGYGSPGSDIPILHIGPVALLAVDSQWLATNTYFMEPTSEGRYEGIKFVLVVNHTAVGPVTVSVPEPDRDHVRLVYDPDRSRPRWEEADHTVKFGVCSDLDAQFNGGFVVNTPTCARVLVSDDGVDGTQWSASIPFGVPVDECPPEG